MAQVTECQTQCNEQQSSNKRYVQPMYGIGTTCSHAQTYRVQHTATMTQFIQPLTTPPHLLQPYSQAIPPYYTGASFLSTRRAVRQASPRVVHDGVTLIIILIAVAILVMHIPRLVCFPSVAPPPPSASPLLCACRRKRQLLLLPPLLLLPRHVQGCRRQGHASPAAGQQQRSGGPGGVLQQQRGGLALVRACAGWGVPGWCGRAGVGAGAGGCVWVRRGQGGSGRVEIGLFPGERDVVCVMVMWIGEREGTGMRGVGTGSWGRWSCVASIVRICGDRIQQGRCC